MVSIALCVKNAELTVKDAIGSILSQDYPHELVELVVVDGYSSDRTMLTIKQALLNADIKYEFFYEAGGLGQARQLAVKNARGDYIVWVDSDIVLSSSYVRKQVEFMESNPDVAIAAGRFNTQKKSSLLGMLQDIDWVVGDYQKRQVSVADPKRICCAGSIYRVRAIKQIGGFDERIIGAAEDIDLGFKVRNSGWSFYFGTNALMWHKGRETWKAIWNESFWYGYGGHYILHKHNGNIPISSFREVVQKVVFAYRMTRRRIVLFLPILLIYKKTAWLLGFFKAHLDNYGHS
jgi:glycosyltransferase involved in cell wall biosynthesis